MAQPGTARGHPGTIELRPRPKATKNVIVLTFHSGSYSILSLAGLSEAQRGELRGILSAVLKKK
jgi:hypothetical protein